MSNDRPKLCRHGAWLTRPCKICNRTLSDIKLAKVLDGLVDGLEAEITRILKVDRLDPAPAYAVRLVSEVFRKTRTDNFGERK